MRLRGLTVLIVSALLLLAIPQLARAHDENAPAKKLVQAAIALIRNQPEQLDEIKDAVKDSLEAKDTTGVDLDLVRKGEAAIDAGDLATAELELELAIGAAPGRVVATPNAEPGEVASPGPELFPHPIGHEKTLGGGLVTPKSAGIAALGLAAALLLVGGFVVRRVH